MADRFFFFFYYGPRVTQRRNKNILTDGVAIIAFVYTKQIHKHFILYF